MRVLLILTALLLSAVPAAVAADPAIESGKAQDALDAARADWAKRGLSDYRFRVRKSCFCPVEYTRGYTVRVRDGRPETRHRYVHDVNSVPKLFRMVQRAITDKVDDLDVTYAADGHPVEIYVDRDFRASDEELRVTLSKLRAEDASASATTLEDAQRALDEARDAWAARNLDDYDFRVARSCFCAPEYTRARDVQVRDGKPISGGKKIRPYATVPRIFAIIQDAIDDNAEVLEAVYGPGGFPRDVYIDYSFMIADEELGITARRLKPRR